MLCASICKLTESSESRHSVKTLAIFDPCINSTDLILSQLWVSGVCAGTLGRLVWNLIWAVKHKGERVQSKQAPRIPSPPAFGMLTGKAPKFSFIFVPCNSQIRGEKAQIPHISHTTSIAPDFACSRFICELFTVGVGVSVNESVQIPLFSEMTLD